MARLQADVPTGHASRYLQQLCKHWSHRFETTFDPTHGVVHLSGGVCTFRAEPQRLSLTLDGEAEVLPRLSDVVAEHLRRFAFREALDIEWREVVAE